MGVGILLLGSLAVVYIFYYLWKNYKSNESSEKIAEPRGYPIIGHIHLFKPEPDAWWQQIEVVMQMFTTEGRVRKGFTKGRMIKGYLMWFPYVVVFGAEEAEDMLNSNTLLSKSYDYSVLHPWIGQGLLTSGGAKWRPRRKLLTPAFHYDILKDFMDVFNSQSKIMMKKIFETVGKLGGTDMAPFLTYCTLDVICQTAMGKSLHSQDNYDSPYVKAIHDFKEIVHDRQKKPWFYIEAIFCLFGRGFEHRRCLKTIHGFTDQVIAERMRDVKEAGGLEGFKKTKDGRKRRLAFLDLLLEMVEQGKMPLADVREEVSTFMFEGHDTTSASMGWTLFLLGNNPQAQEKVHQEIEMVFGDDTRDVTWEDLTKLEYLERVIKESLRLYPSVPLMGRTVSEQTKIGKAIVPAGCQILLIPYGVHQDERYWPDPLTFDPDRFLPENSVGRHAFAYLPFSAGSRNCIGQRFALMEEKTILSWIFRYYKVTSLKRVDEVRPCPTLILTAKGGYPLQMELKRDIDFGDTPSPDF